MVWSTKAIPYQAGWGGVDPIRMDEAVWQTAVSNCGRVRSGVGIYHAQEDLAR
jgi:hypothetical protein